MKLLAWTEQLPRKISERNLALGLTGKLLFMFFLGTQFSHVLVKYSYGLLLAGIFILVSAFIEYYAYWHHKKSLSFAVLVWGTIGVYLLILFFGIQSPQIPYKLVLLLLSVLLLIPANVDLLRKK